MNEAASLKKREQELDMAIPEPGQLVEVRRRQWIVTDIQTSAFETSKVAVPQHLVSLVSLDEDTPNEPLSVIWEIEPGARILETAGLPNIDGWDSCERIEAFLDAVRWGASTDADRTLLQAPFRSGVEIQDYQLDPLVRSIDMARVNLLIADDVGLGKTIEAGLVIQEMLVRHRARTVLVVCPASLQVKWQTEMREKFGLEFRIVDTDYIKKLRRERGIHANPWTSFPRLISSMDWMKSGEGLRLLKDTLPPHITYPRKFDILVVDEAHNIAPAAALRYAMPSWRTRLIRTLAPHFEHRLFLSATPHNGYQESFTSLLELLDDQRFARGVMPDEKQLQRVMVRRLKTDLVDEKGQPIYPKREILPLEVDYTDQEREIHALLKSYIDSRSRQASGSTMAFGMEFIHKLLKKRLFSSPRAFAATLEQHIRSLSQKTFKKEKSSLKERILHKAIAKTEEDYADDNKFEQAETEAVEVASELSMSLTDDQRRILDGLVKWAEASKNRPDSKAKAILGWLDDHLKTDGKDNGKRVILFTEYRATHSWLKEIFSSTGWGNDKLMLLHGSMDQEEREIVKAAFQAHPDVSPVRILLATDAASEGIDLQNHCNYMIHVEIPWNPNVLEQRNGRIDRHGQRESRVCIWHPVGKSAGSAKGAPGSGNVEGDHEFLLRAVRKIDTIREDLGCVGPVIAKQIEEAMLGKRRDMDTNEAETRAAKAKKFVVAERELNSRIARLHQNLLDARKELRLTPERVVRAVNIALEMAGKPLLQALEARHGLSNAYSVPMLTGSWERATRGLEHPHTGKRRPVTFDHAVVKGRDDVVLAHLNHELVQMSLRLLRAEVWAHEDRKKLARIAVRSIPRSVSTEPIVLVWSRLVITGGGHHRLHEELTMAGGELKEKGFTRIRAIGKLDELLAASQPTRLSQKAFDVLKKRFIENKENILKAVDGRSKDLLEFKVGTLERRRKNEEKDLEQVLADLDKMIRKELSETKQMFQLDLFSTDERDQLKRDLEALRLRLERIPDEKERELGAIRHRYTDPSDRTFPVAIEFLIPEDFKE
jgi:superfamily II DNA or RNA helicase